MPKSKEQFDVVIVGAGFTGVTLAFSLAIAGKKVIVFDKRKEINASNDLTCYIDKKIYASFLSSIYRSVKFISTNNYFMINDGKKVIKAPKSDYVAINLANYINEMVEKASKAGAKFVFETEIVDPVGRGQWVIGVKTKEGNIIEGKIVIDCSGDARILTKNIEILDLNTKISLSDLAEYYYAKNNCTGEELYLDEISLEENSTYYIFNSEKIQMIERDDSSSISFSTIITKEKTSKKAKSITNKLINAVKKVDPKPVLSFSKTFIVRRPITLVWYGFLSVGEAACQNNPFFCTGLNSASIALKIASETVLKALQRKESSIYKLWEYNVKYFKEMGRDYAAIEAFRKLLQSFNEEELVLLFSKRLISMQDVNKILHDKFPKWSTFDFIIKFLKGLGTLKITAKFLKGMRGVNRIFHHYKKIPDEYSPKAYHDWYIKQLYLFKMLNELSEKMSKS